MRRVLISLLLASAAVTPAVAAPHGFNRQEAREDRAQAREDARSERSESRPSVTPRQPQAQPRPQAQRAQAQRPQAQRPQAQRPPRVASQRNPRAVRALNPSRGAGNFVPRGEARQRADDRRQSAPLRQSTRPVPPVVRNPGAISNVPRPGTQPPPRVAQGRHQGQAHWNHNWRNDHRYDWRNYRRHHRSLFHFGFYSDPFGWGYQPFSIGWRLWPAYFGRQYWINDPWTYRLPYAPAGYTWIRYWNDAILVDTYSGTVIDVIPGFFW